MIGSAACLKISSCLHPGSNTISKVNILLLSPYLLVLTETSPREESTLTIVSWFFDFSSVDMGRQRTATFTHSAFSDIV